MCIYEKDGPTSICWVGRSHRPNDDRTLKFPRNVKLHPTLNLHENPHLHSSRRSIVYKNMSICTRFD